MRLALKILFFCVSIGILMACSNQPDENNSIRKALGEVQYGETLKMQSTEKIDVLFPMASTNSYSRNISCQLFETLLKTDMQSMRTVPNIATNFEVKDEGKTYLLTIRKNVYFHSDPCFSVSKRKLTVEDVKYSLDFACSGWELNKSSYLLVNKIVGAKKYHARTKTKLTKSGVSGIKILNDSTVKIELVEAFSGFEKILSHNSLSIIAKEAVEKYGKSVYLHPVGTGPFVLQEFTKEKIILKRFENYWRKDKFGNTLPYLNGVELSYSKNKIEELENFRSEKTDIVLNISVEQIDYILGSLMEAQNGENIRHKVLSEPSMSVMYIGFANDSKEFSDIRVRKAFNMAVNRIELVNKYLGGEGWPSEHGFIPPLDFYPNDDVKSLPFDTLEAQKLLSAAGYPKGKGFPKLEIYINAQENSTGHKMLKGIVHQLKKNLGIELGIKLCSIKDRDKAIATGKAKIWRAGWIADYAHPENFLSLFYSGNIGKNNSVNSFHYRNTEFDDLLNHAIKEQDEAIRNQYFVFADQKVVDDAVCMPILTDDLIVLVNVKVKNFIPNPMEILDLSTIFIKASK